MHQLNIMYQFEALRCTNSIQCIELESQLDTLYLVDLPTIKSIKLESQLDTLYRVEVPRASIRYNVSTWKVEHFIEVEGQLDTLYLVDRRSRQILSIWKVK